MSTGAVRIVFLIFILQHQGWADLLEDDCGLRIEGGQNAFFNPYPWMAIIRTPVQVICAGSLINNRFVLTAAHCIVNQTRLIVRLGEYDQSTDVDCRGSYCLPPFEEYYVEKVYLYSKFNFVDHGKDIGLLRLERQVAYKVHIQPICIILDAQRKAETDLIPEYIATGWGKTEKNVVNKVLKEVTIQRSDPQWCRNHFWKQLNSSQICGTSNAGDTCDADSGAPLGRLIRFGNVWRFVQFGVASYSLPDCSGIGVYTDVMSYVDWIRGSVRESGIADVLPRMDLLDGACLSNSTSSSSNHFPWLARVYMGPTPLAYGTLISENFVVTVAHNIHNRAPLQVCFGKEGPFDPELTYQVEFRSSHRRFNAVPAYDITLLKLATKVQYTDNIRPICLPSTENGLKMFIRQQGNQEFLTVLGYYSFNTAVARRYNRSWFQRSSSNEKLEEGEVVMAHPDLSGMGMQIINGCPVVWLLKNGNGQAYAPMGILRYQKGDKYVYTDVLHHMSWIWGEIKKKNH